MTEPVTEVTRMLARYVVGARPGDTPAAVLHEAKRSFLNWIGCAVGGCRHEAVEKAMQVVRDLSGAPRATVIGRRDRLDVVQATLINAMSSLVLDFDDAHSGDKIVLHPAGPVGPAAAALAEQAGSTGQELLHAFLLGIEVECRIGNAVYPSDNVGWYLTSTMGAFGAAACAGRLLRLNEQQMTWALGLAAAQSAGLRATHGTMTKSFSPGRAASSGVLAALLAAADFTSAENVVEAPAVGFADLMGSSERLASVTAGLGERFQVSRNTYKPYACAIGMHPSVAGCLQLRAEHDLTPVQIEKVELQVFPRVIKANGIRQPKNGLEAKISLTHAIAAALVEGKAGEQQFVDAKAGDHEVSMLRERISAVAEPGFGKNEAHVRIHLKDGRTLTTHVEQALGTLERPMSDRDLELKVSGLAEGVLTSMQTDRLIQHCWELDDLPGMEPLRAAVTPG
ncbi:MAG: MmgE/PrpD family protein [Burkholderiales bacterium]